MSGDYKAPPPPSPNTLAAAVAAAEVSGTLPVFPRTASADFHVTALKARPHSTKIWLDAEENCLRFLVMKKLNLFATGKRMIVLDFNKKEIRNETVRVQGETVQPGEVLKKFLFKDVKELVDGSHDDHPEEEVSPSTHPITDSQ